MKKKILFSSGFIFIVILVVCFLLFKNNYNSNDITVYHNESKIPIIKNTGTDEINIDWNSMENGSLLYNEMKDIDDYSLMKNLDKIKINVADNAKLTDLKYDYLIYDYSVLRDIDKTLPRVRNPSLPTIKAPFHKYNNDYISEFKYEFKAHLSSEAFLGYVYTATIEIDGQSLIYNFFIPQSKEV